MTKKIDEDDLDDLGRLLAALDAAADHTWVIHGEEALAVDPQDGLTLLIDCERATPGTLAWLAEGRRLGLSFPWLRPRLNEARQPTRTAPLRDRGDATRRKRGVTAQVPIENHRLPGNEVNNASQRPHMFTPPAGGVARCPRPNLFYEEVNMTAIYTGQRVTLAEGTTGIIIDANPHEIPWDDPRYDVRAMVMRPDPIVVSVAAVAAVLPIVEAL
jgi:hypothetical protein